MNIIAVLGESGSGKTRLIQRLIRELKRRGRSAAVIKHCPHGFELDVKGKDSWRMMAAGAAGVGMVSSDRLAVLRRAKSDEPFSTFAASHFRDVDFVLVEGGYGVKGLKTIEVLRKGKRSEAKSDPKDRLAVVASFRVDAGCPVFRPGQVAAIADVLTATLPAFGSPVSLEVDGRAVPLNPFVQNLAENIVLALTKSLRGTGKSPTRIVLSVSRTESRLKDRKFKRRSSS